MIIHSPKRRADRRPPKPSSMPFDRAYVSKAFLMGLPGCMGFMLLLYFVDEFELSSVMIISYILYPFAKFLYDVILGVRLGRIIKNPKNELVGRELDKIQFGMHYIFIFILSIFLAPFGMLFLLIRRLFRFYRTRMKS
ncbi:hypothetical protein SFC66_16000 [Terribacillus saccharophilus]|uniref:hypothetical protein n=1 Tax=Terribacillus saccharophilus TaxID=361277 RepID=UPI003981A554